MKSKNIKVKAKIVKVDKYSPKIVLNEAIGSEVLKCHSDNPKDCKEVQYQIGCGNCSKFY